MHKISVDDVVAAIDECWSESGFLYRVRAGAFDEKSGEEFLEMLRSMDLERETSVPVRLVKQLWFLPLFLEWQKERVEELGSGPAFKRFRNQLFSVLEDVVGFP